MLLSLPSWHASSHNFRLSSMMLDVKKHSSKPHLRQMEPEHSPFWHTCVLPLHSVRSGRGGGSGHLAEMPLQVDLPLHSPASLHCCCNKAGTYLQSEVQHWPWLGLHRDPVQGKSASDMIRRHKMGQPLLATNLDAVCILEHWD